jgi:hypothetical protein
MANDEKLPDLPERVPEKVPVKVPRPDLPTNDPRNQR